MLQTNWLCCMMIYPGHLLLIDVVVALQKEEENGDGNGSDDVDDVDGYPSFSLLFFVLLCFIIIFFMLSKDFFSSLKLMWKEMLLCASVAAVDNSIGFHRFPSAILDWIHTLRIISK